MYKIIACVHVSEEREEEKEYGHATHIKYGKLLQHNQNHIQINIG